MKSPKYIISLKTLEKNIETFRTLVRLNYPNFNIAYSCKTNNNESILRKVNEMGELIDVVSLKEYKEAKAAGFENKKIVYNGVTDDFKHKLKCSIKGGIVNIENISQLEMFKKYAEEKQTLLKIGVRLTFDIGKGNKSRFGINYESSDFEKVLEADKSKFLKIAHIHCHITEARELNYWEERIRKMIDISQHFEIETINLGGNMFGEMKPFLEYQFNNTCKLKDYARVISSEMKKAYPNGNVKLITENGTSVIGNAVNIKANVISEKNINGKKAYTLNCNVYNFGFIIKTKNLPYKIIRRKGVKKQKDLSTVYGNTCTEEDVIIPVLKESVSVGDSIVFYNVGAYASVMASDFISEKPIVKIKN